MIRSTPTLNTSRVTLRAMRPEDFDRFAAICAMPNALRPVSGRPWPRRLALSRYRMARWLQISSTRPRMLPII